MSNDEKAPPTLGISVSEKVTVEDRMGRPTKPCLLCSLGLTHVCTGTVHSVKKVE